MRAVVTRVRHASVAIDGAVRGQIGQGFLILLGITHEDTEALALKLADKICSLRIFEDENGKMNVGLAEAGGELLVISQFTLMANYRHGNRPDFMASAKPDEANRLYEYFMSLAKKEIRRVEAGVFGAHMEVSLMNDGPVTIVMDSEVLKSKK